MKRTIRNDFWREKVGDPIVVVINGIGGVGKDTFVECCRYVTVGICENDTVGICENEYLKLYLPIIANMSTIDEVKDFIYKFGIPREFKTDKERKLLSDIKKALTEYDPNIIYNRVCKAIDCGIYKVCFVHCREPEEIKRFVEDYDAKTLLIRRNGIDVPQNSSDMSVENYDYDYIINNNGSIEDLKEKAKDFLRWLGCGSFIDEGVKYI